jgi:glutamate synthase domain-containing protein 3
LTSDDEAFLKDTVQRHRDFTGSTVAAGLLASWELKSSQFRKVMPSDYKRVLEVIEQSKAAGLDEDATTDAIMASAKQ